MSANQIDFLLVEDDDIDVMAMKRAFSKHKISNHLHVARDGIEALEMLRGENGHPAVSPPFVIVLDLNMPRMNGIEFLDAIRNDEKLGGSIVFVFTTSNASDDRCNAFRRCVAGYFLKSGKQNSTAEMVELLDRYSRIAAFPEVSP